MSKKMKACKRIVYRLWKLMHIGLIAVNLFLLREKKEQLRNGVFAVICSFFSPNYYFMYLFHQYYIYIYIKDTL